MSKVVLITGGAGFIGINSAKHFIEQGYKVILVDNLTRAGSQGNIDWLKNSGFDFEFIKCDICNYQQLANIYENNSIDLTLHLAAQVAVTLSVADPVADFQTNLVGSLNVLEAIRNHQPQCVAVYASTNKVYGNLEQLAIKEEDSRYSLVDCVNGVDENINLDFHSPYGCSKGGADQYFVDYGRIYGLSTVVFRQSCIYGPRQFGVEDQGWLAWFFIASKILGRKITIYGNGKQVRDVLYVKDLVKLYETAFLNSDKCRGEAYNIGGGLENTFSLLEFILFANDHLNADIKYDFGELRSGDQRIFVADIAKVNKDLQWTPQTSKTDGVKQLYQWIQQNENLIRSFFT